MILSLLTCVICCIGAEAASAVQSTPDPAEFAPVASADSLELQRDSPIDYSYTSSREESEPVGLGEEAVTHTAPLLAEIGDALLHAIQSGRIDPQYVVTDEGGVGPLMIEIDAAPSAAQSTGTGSNWVDDLAVVRKSLPVRSIAVGESLASQPRWESPGFPVISEETRTYLRPLNGPVDAVFVTHKYSGEYLASLRADTARMLERQVEADFDMRGSTPLLEHDSEMVMGTDERAVRLALDGTISRSDDTVVFATKSFPGVIVKYQTDCNALAEGDLIHPLVREAWFTENLSRQNLTPVVYFISPPTWLNYPVTPKTRFEMSRQRRADLTGKCTVRYVVMDDAGQTLSTYMAALFADNGTSMAIPTALLVLDEVLKGLKRIHRSGIIHGDIHADNVALHDDGDDHSSIRFTGFGQAFLAAQTAGTSVLVADPFQSAHCLFSHWELLGYRKAYRDDVFNALWMASYLMNGDALNQHADSLAAARAVMAFKRDAFWFEVPGKRSVFEVLPRDIREEVKRGLDHMLSLVRAMDQIDAMPPYDELLAQLRLTIDLVHTDQ